MLIPQNNGILSSTSPFIKPITWTFGQPETRPTKNQTASNIASNKWTNREIKRNVRDQSRYGASLVFIEAAFPANELNLLHHQVPGTALNRILNHLNSTFQKSCQHSSLSSNLMNLRVEFLLYLYKWNHFNFFSPPIFCICTQLQQPKTCETHFKRCDSLYSKKGLQSEMQRHTNTHSTMISISSTNKLIPTKNLCWNEAKNTKIANAIYNTLYYPPSLEIQLVIKNSQNQMKLRVACWQPDHPPWALSGKTHLCVKMGRLLSQERRPMFAGNTYKIWTKQIAQNRTWRTLLAQRTFPACWHTITPFWCLNNVNHILNAADILANATDWSNYHSPKTLLR